MAVEENNVMMRVTLSTCQMVAITVASACDFKKWLLFSTSPCVQLLSQIFLSQTPISNPPLFFIFLFWFVYSTYYLFLSYSTSTL